MAIFQSALGFFLPSQRRRRPAAGGGGAPSDPTLNRVVGEIDAVLEDINAPAKVGGFIKKDLEDAFTAKSTKSPYYTPGRMPPQVEISTFGLLADPFGTLGKAFAAPLQKDWQELLLKPTGDEISRRLDREIWNRLFDKVWDRSQVPTSLQTIVDRWSVRKDIEAQRRGIAKAFLDSPGATLMMAQKLSRYYSQIPGAQYDAGLLDKAQKFTAFSARAREYESLLSQAISGKNWELADKIQERWQREGKSVAAEVSKEFNSLVKKGGDLADSQEAQIFRFWKARNVHYGTLNFLRTYKEKGAWGVIQFYGWGEVKKRLKYAEFGKFVSAKVLGPLGLNRLANLAAGLQRTFRNLTSGLVKKGAIWVLEKLGLKAALTAIGGALGSIVPGAGTALGAIAGAVLQFVAEVVVEKLGGIFKLVGYVLAGVVGFFALAAVGTAALISIILSNKPYPWEVIATEVDCDTSATATASCFPKSLVQQVADNWGLGPGNQVEACYSDVVAKSNDAGIDPGISLATWLHESNASNYELYVRLGEPPQDFGIPSRAGQGFTAQIEAFINIYNNFYPSEFAACYTGYSEMEGFFRAFCTAGREEFGVGQCPNLTSVGENCVKEYLDTYAWIRSCR